MRATQFLNDQNLQTVPLLRLTDVIPDNAQVICIGKNQMNLLHNMWFQLQLPDIKKKEFRLAKDTGHASAKNTEEFLHKSSYWPHHPHFSFALDYAEHIDPKNYDFKSASIAATDGKVIQDMTASLCASSTYRIQKTAVKLGVPLAFVGDRSNPVSHTYTEHTEKISMELTDMVRQGHRLVYFGGRDFLYGAPKSGGPEKSLQHHLKEQGVVCHSIALANDFSDFFPVSATGRYIREIDPSVFVRMQNDLCKEKELSATQSFYINMHDCAPEQAGTVLPDAVIGFSNQGSMILQTAHMRHNGYYNKPQLEDGLLGALWVQAGVRNAHSYFKEQRKNDKMKNG